MKGNKFLAAALAASMVFSTVPATALNVFADSVSVEASDTQWKNGNVSVAVDPDLKGTDATAETIKTTLNEATGIDIETYYNFASNTFNSDPNGKDALITAIEALVTGYSVDSDSIKVTDKNHWSFRLVSVSDADEVYNVTVAVTETDLKDAAANSAAEKAYTLLQDFFASNTFYTYDNKSLTANSVANTVRTGLSTKLPADTTVTGDSTAVASDGTGKLSVAVGGTTYVYHFTANVEKSSDSEAAALQAAIEKVEGNTYPSVASTDTTDGKAALIAKIAKDLKAAGFNGSEATITTKLNALSLVSATATQDGKLIGIIDNQYPVDITLKYSSKDKDADTVKSLTDNFLKGRAVSGTTYTVGTTAGVPVYQFDAGSKLSNDVQKSTDIKAAEMSDVIKAVQDAITTQLTTDKVADNGVSVSVTECKNAKDGSDKKVTSNKATASAPGKYVLLVKTSIANDFYGYKKDSSTDVYNGTKNDGDKATVENQYVVIVETRALQAKAAASVSVADQTVVQKGNYTSSLKSDGNSATPAVAVDVFDLKAVVSPEDSNSSVTWSVTDENGAATTDAFVTNKFGNNDATITKAGATDATYDGTTKLSATDGKLIVFKKGTYKVTATVDGKTATATFTVLDRFKDVRSGAYYEDPIKEAYAADITSGTASDTFGVNDNTTRAQFVTWLYRTAVANDPTEAVADADLKEQFSDVATDKYYAKAVQWAVDNKITVGTSDTTFSPNADITRAQAVTMLWRYVGKADTGAHGSEADYTKRFTDLPSNATYAAAITWAVNNEITTGTTLTTFSPDATATRAQSITFISNAHLFG